MAIESHSSQCLLYHGGGKERLRSQRQIMPHTTEFPPVMFELDLRQRVS